MSEGVGDLTVGDRARLHLRAGWWSLLVFLSLGAALESLHGFKVGWYLDVGNEARRLTWTLAHAHGTLLSLIQIVFGATLPVLPAWRGAAVASRCLLAALILIPSGFFIGGAFVHGDDPGLGVLLVPAGAVFLFVAVLLTALASEAGDRGAD